MSEAKAGMKRVVRTVQPAQVLEFDEQLWPINLVLLILAGFEAGLVIATSDFQTADPWLNGWVRLVALGLIVGLLGAGVLVLQGRMQRRMQLAILLSLLAHLWLFFGLQYVHLSMGVPPKDAKSAALEEETELVTMPDYHWQDNQQEVVNDKLIESAVLTATSDAPTPELQKDPTQPATEAQPEATQQPQAEATLPSAQQMEKAELSAPRRAEQIAGEKISRQDERGQQPMEEAATVAMDQATESLAGPEAQVTELARAEASAQVEQPRRSDASDQPDVQADQARMSRQTSESEMPDPSDALTRLERQTEQATPTADATAIDTNPASAPERASRDDPAPAVSAAERQQEIPAAQASRARNADSAAQPEDQPMARADQAAQADRSPRADASDAALERTMNGAQAEAVDAGQAQVGTPAETAAGEESLEPTLAEQQRTSGGVDSPAIAQDGSPAETMGDPQMSADAANPRRAEASEVASAQQGGAGAHNVARADTNATTEGEPEFAEAATSGDAATAGEAAPTATQTGIAKADGGAPGMTRQRNFDTDLPGTGQASQAPSAAARRAAASQEMDPGDAAQPSDLSPIGRSRVGADASSATLPAEEVATADAAGSTNPGEVDASSSASVERNASSAPRGRITAASGASSVDVGPPAVVSRVGQGRTSGGGEAARSDGSETNRIERSRSGQGELGGVAGDSPNPVDVAGGEVGAGRGAADEPGPTVGDAARGSAGGVADVPRASSAGAGTGGADPSGGEPAGGDGADVARASRDENAGRAGTGGGANAGRIARASAGGAESNGTGEGDEVGPVETDPNGGGGTESGIASDVADPNATGTRRQSGAAPGDAGRVAGASTGADQIADTSGSSGGGAGDIPRRVSGDDSGAASRQESGAPSSVARTGSDAGAVDDGTLDPGLAEVASPSDGDLDPSATAGDEGTGSTQRRSSSLQVQVAAASAEGGLSSDPALDTGLPSRRARPESDVAHTAPGRLILDRAGGKLPAEVRVQDAAVPGFKQRDREMREEVARQRGGSEGSERAVEMGLDFLARHQNPDGSWSLHNFSQGRQGYENAGFASMQSDTAGTGLALLAFLGAGYTHTDGKHRLTVGRALDFLIQNQAEDGDLFIPQDPKSNAVVRLYSHGIASISLCEAYGMTRDPVIKEPAQRALAFIANAQSPTEGGWRYAPQRGSDTSVSGWQLMALKSGELAGLEVSHECYLKVEKWLDGAQSSSNPALYVYRPKAEQAHQREPSRVMTAESLLMRQYLGWKRDNPYMVEGANFLRANLPTLEGPGARDAYYWYYATQVMFQMQGDYWQDWNRELRALLTTSQVQTGNLAGSWDPIAPAPDRWGRHGGRIYVTAMHLLMLEVYYRHLPLYQNLEE